MSTTNDTRSAASLRAEAFYDAELRDKLEPAQNGKHIVIDSNSLDYEVDANAVVASVHLRDRRPDARTVSFQIGHYSNWPTRPRRNALSPESAGDASGRFGKKVAPPEIGRSSASLEAEAFYNAGLRAKLEPAEKGKFILIDGKSHDYEVDADLIAATVHLRDRQPSGEWFIFRIGDTDTERSALHGMRMTLKP